MPITNVAIDLFISKRAASVSECKAVKMASKEPESANWLANFGLAAIFNDWPPEPMRPFAITFIRRIRMAFIEYDLGVVALTELTQDGAGRISPYFIALTHFELAVGQLYVALNYVAKVSSTKFFEKHDGSFEQNLNAIYNASKHELPTSEEVTWLTNDGLECSDAKILFVEVEDFMSTMAGVVNGLCNRNIGESFIKSTAARQV